ncbi:MAG TPA: RnfH family protein [Wenzhouxiangellaceae bacterium]|nr:RnfH family protein [Wenzhouxiangellaceae bacterium]
MAEDSRRIAVEVAVAWPELQAVVPLRLAENSTVADAIELSGLAERFPALEISPERLGVFAERRSPDDRLRDGDRVEIYRPLKVDPKVARRLAAEAKRQR